MFVNVNMKDEFDNKPNEKLTSWHFWCRLCSKNNEENKIRILLKDEPDEDRGLFDGIEKFEYSKNTRIRDALQRYFGINIAEHEEIPTHLCRECYSLLASLMQFTEVVNKTQNMFQYLLKEDQHIEEDLKCVREKFEFYDDNNYSFKNLLDGFEFELSFARNSTEPYEENPLDIKETKRCSKKNINIKMSDSESEISSYDGSSDSDYECVQKTAKSKTYNCGQCRAKFESDREYRVHLKSTHPKRSTPKETPAKKKDNEIFNCPHCAEFFKSKTKKDLHIRQRHPDQNSYVCDQCGFGMKSSRSLRQHMVTHTDYAPYTCPTCNKNFKQKVGLKRHMEIHDPEKYICPKCGKQLNSRSTLNSHLLLHSEALRHKCQYCGRAFKLSKTLKNHLILHTGLRPYVCDFCGSTFAQGSSCRAHKKRAHPKELAEQEAAGIRTFTQNIPTISALKAFTSKEAMNLSLDKKMVNRQAEENSSIQTNFLKPLELTQS